MGGSKKDGDHERVSAAEATISSLEIRVARLERTELGNIDGDIWFHIAGIDFPAANWFDYPLTLLWWWIEHVRALLGRQQREVDLVFMDGDYTVHLTRLAGSGRASYECRDGDEEFDIVHAGDLSLVELLWQLLRAARHALDMCEQEGWSSHDIDQLKSVL